MEVFYFHVAADVPNDQPSSTAVVIDVLRATTTIACALKNGAAAIQTFADVEQLWQEASNWPESSRILIGERGGKRIDGFDLGNSPNDVQPDLVKGKRIFMSTTNGTRSLERVKDFETLYTLALVNRSFVADRLLADMPKSVCILGSGWEGSYSLEDSLAAGALVSYLLESGSRDVHIANDELQAALALWSIWRENPLGCLMESTHGKRLQRIGNHHEDFACCSNLDSINVIPFQSEPGVLSST